MTSARTDPTLQLAGFGATFINLTNTTLGAGILSFPYAYAHGGTLARRLLSLTLTRAAWAAASASSAQQ